MKKKPLIYISIIILIIILIYFLINKYFIKRKKTIKEALIDIKNTYGYEIAKNVEKIFRLETNNFKSEQYKKCFSAGMVSFAENYPYGWNNLSLFWAIKSKYKPVGIGYTFTNIEGQKYKYLKFENYGGFYSLAEFLENHNNNAGRWNSTNLIDQERYNNAIALIKNEYII